MEKTFPKPECVLNEEIRALKEEHERLSCENKKLREEYSETCRNIERLLSQNVALRNNLEFYKEIIRGLLPGNRKKGDD